MAAGLKPEVLEHSDWCNMPEQAQDSLVLNAERKQLSDAYDELNATWLSFEDRLRSLMVPHECKVGVSAPTEAAPAVYLVWAKYGSKWRACHGVEWEGEWVEMKPVSDCTVDVRLSAIPFAKRLFDAVRSRMSETINSVQTATGELASLLKAIRGD